MVEIKKAYRRGSLIHHPDNVCSRFHPRFVATARSWIACTGAKILPTLTNTLPRMKRTAPPYDSDEELADILFAQMFGRSYGSDSSFNW